MARDCGNQKPEYVSNKQASDLLGGKLAEMADLISVATGRAVEHGGFLVEGDLKTQHVRGMSRPGISFLEIEDIHKTIAYNKRKCVIIDDQAINAMADAALALHIIKSHPATIDPFYVASDGPMERHLAGALLEERLCKQVVVPTQEMAQYLNEDDVAVGRAGIGCLVRDLADVPEGAEFVVLCGGESQSPARSGATPAGRPPEVFRCSTSLVCKFAAIRMLMDALETQHGMS